jgi:hypothetical protein
MASHQIEAIQHGLHIRNKTVEHHKRIFWARFDDKHIKMLQCTVGMMSDIKANGRINLATKP